MKETDNLDELIKQYSESLMKVYKKRPSEPEEEAVAVVADGKMTEDPTKEEVSPETNETPAEVPTDKAAFMAAVRTGSGAFPVPEAKVIVGKDSSIVAFLVTDENGETAKITLPAYAEKDSLSADTAKTVSYYADIYAEGFQEKRNLPVEASGGAEILLNVELTPLAERME